MTGKQVIYQVFTRLYGNRNITRHMNGTIEENGCGKMDDFTPKVLNRWARMGITHVWYTGVIRHATMTDYSAYGIPKQHPAVVKGCAGSPYAIADYYDVDPDLATDVDHRMEELEALLQRTHEAGLKVIIDFVPNHVARQYHSICKPANVSDLGEDDHVDRGFDPVDNNFYYCPGQAFVPCFDLYHGEATPYEEYPAKATGNDHFDNAPGRNDWYETVKLNYGVDYYAGGVLYDNPMPNTWKKMTDILLFWAAKGIDGFRCDMAEMVPAAFWSYATKAVKEQYPDIHFIGEVYNPSLYRSYISAGFDLLYDKVGMYDTMRAVITGQAATSAITSAWQQTDDIRQHMLYFLENHDEQRIASTFFAGEARRGVPAMMASMLMQQNPFMLYFGEEYGERGMDHEGFSGCDGRTTIFDYWSIDTLCRAASRKLTADEKLVYAQHEQTMQIARREKAISEGTFFDLMYVNPHLHRQYAFLRHIGHDLLLVVVNFEDHEVDVDVNLPKHAFDFLQVASGEYVATELWSKTKTNIDLHPDKAVRLQVGANGGVVMKMKVTVSENHKTMENIILNEHHKEEFPPAHTAEHLLNQTMMRIFGCERSFNAHIERKKSKMSFHLSHKPSRQEEKEIEQTMNRLIEEDLPVEFEFVDRNNLPEGVSPDRLPEDASETIRLVRIGDYDVCPCIGKHVRSTSQIGRFELLGTNWDEENKVFRVRFKVVQ